MNEIIPFKYHDTNIRVRNEAGEPIFVAKDIAPILGYSRTDSMTRYLDDDEKGSSNWRTLGGEQALAHVTEPGLYSAIMRSTSPEARPFRRWVTHEVLPELRKTGSYAVGQPIELTGPELMAKALIEANSTLQAQAQALIEAQPKVEAFEAFLSSNGDYSVGETAKILARDHEIVTGEKRLFSQLEAWGWIYRNAKGRPIAYQTHVDNGRLAHRARFYTNWNTGEQMTATPQVRITAKGINSIAQKIKEQMEISA